MAAVTPADALIRRVPRIEFANGLRDDFVRFRAHWELFEVADRTERIGEMVQAIEILRSSPLVGRPVRGGLRELVIGHGSRGYVALYRYVPRLDTVFVLAIRSRREAGFKRRT